jgi:uncharacterized DUF497 family protein
MQFLSTPDKEEENKRKHGLDFSFAPIIFSDPLVLIVYDRYENGEHRYHAIATIGWTCFVLVHAYPDPDNEDLVRVIGLREATPYERKRYEEGDYDG